MRSVSKKTRSQMFDQRVEVSDHAVVRYLQRVKGLDVDGVRAEIAAKVKNPDKYAQFLKGATAKVRSSGMVLVITAYPEDKRSEENHKGRAAKHSANDRGGA